MVGNAVVKRLLDHGYVVRVLSRGKRLYDARAEVYEGSLEDENSLRHLVTGAHLVFHCAAELRDKSKMWEVNVHGTERLIRSLRGSEVHYLCHLSSAGVIGRTDVKWVDEETACDPQNEYERSKLAAEQIAARGIDGCRVVILRPVNVIDDDRPGALGLPMSGSFKSRLKVILKGGECAHIVHADDVAAAAIHFIPTQFVDPRCYFVSCDREPLNTFAGLWALYRATESFRNVSNMQLFPHVHLWIPYAMRRLYRGGGNRGDVRYSSDKLLRDGFTFTLGVHGAVKRIVDKAGLSQQ